MRTDADEDERQFFLPHWHYLSQTIHFTYVDKLMSLATARYMQGNGQTPL